MQQENENKGFATSASGIPLANEWQQLDAPQRSRLALCLLDRLASVDFAKTCKVLNFLLEEYHQTVDAGKVQVNSEQALQSASLALAKLGMIADGSGQLSGRHDQGLRFLLGDCGQLFVGALAQAGLTSDQSAVLLACYVNTPVLVDIMARCEDYWADQPSAPEITTGQLIAHWLNSGADDHSLLCRSSQKGNPANAIDISGWLMSIVVWGVLPVEVSGNAASIAPTVASSTIASTSVPCCRNGDPGQKGQQGQRGNKGETGPPGPIGLPGLPGEPGPKGNTVFCESIGSNTSSACTKGLKGLQGQRGIKGLKGLKGVKGLRGLKGDMGPPGIKGDSGLPGRSVLPGELPSCGPGQCFVPGLLAGAISGGALLAIGGAIYAGYKLYEWSSHRASAAGNAERDMERPTTSATVDAETEELRQMLVGKKVRQRIDQIEQGNV